MKYITVVFILLSTICHASHELYKKLGAHPNAQGTKFSLFAPSAKEVTLILKDKYPMKKGPSGVWEVDVRGAKEGSSYLFQITGKDGKRVKKVDPFAFKIDDAYRSVVHQSTFQWTDGAWLEERKKFANKDFPISIYELHISSWIKGASYKGLAKELARYCKDAGFTHVEVFGVIDHSSDKSWGYHPISFFAPNHRLKGDFEEFVNEMHKEGIGVIIDFVAGHFSSNSIGLSKFDGTALYEYANSREAWGALLFDYAKECTQDLLQSCCYFWLNEMHVDGIRLDSLDTIIDNADNYDCIKRFMRKMNALAKDNFPGILMIAECWKSGDITSADGFGFDFKWTGATNGVLEFFKKPFKMRDPYFHAITSASFQDANEKLIWHTDHDKSRKETGSLYQQFPGSHFEKCSQMKLLIGYFMTLVGKKMVFMGDDFAQKKDWDTLLLDKAAGSSVQWKLRSDASHKGVANMVRDLNALYKERYDLHCFNQIKMVHTDTKNHVIAYKRGSLLVVCNFGYRSFNRYDVHAKGVVREVFNSDHETYGGTSMLNLGLQGKKSVTTIALPPFSVLIFECR